MARISSLFAEGTVKEVYHINGAPSNELVNHLTADRLPKNVESLSIEGNKSAIASIIEKGDSAFLAIVNKDFRNPIRLHINGKSFPPNPIAFSPFMKRTGGKPCRSDTANIIPLSASLT